MATCCIYGYEQVINALSNAVNPIFDRNHTKPYVLKKAWVQNFIKFQYIFEGKQGRPTIVPIGCVPTNTQNGKILKAGEKFIGQEFVFSCEQAEDGVLSYEAIACVDADQIEMSIGETRRLSNGTVLLHCNIFGGALKKVSERVAGCYFNETIYEENDQWIEPLKRNQGPISGLLKECFRPHYSYYEAHVIGCAIGKLGIRLEEFAQLNDGSYVQCSMAETPGGVFLKNVTVDDLACTLDDKPIPHDSHVNDTSRAAQLFCSYGQLVKTGCLLDNELITIGQELKISNGCSFLCHTSYNVYVCEKKLGDFKIIGGDTDSLRRMLF